MERDIKFFWTWILVVVIAGFACLVFGCAPAKAGPAAVATAPEVAGELLVVTEPASIDISFETCDLYDSAWKNRLRTVNGSLTVKCDALDNKQAVCDVGPGEETHFQGTWEGEAQGTARLHVMAISAPTVHLQVDCSQGHCSTVRVWAEKSGAAMICKREQADPKASGTTLIDL
jgi:hypothetical protein